MAECALVGEAQVRAAVGEREPGPHVRRQRAVRFPDEHLAAHAEVGEHRFCVVEGEPEVLAPAFGALEVAAGHGGGEAKRPRGITAHRARVEHLHVLDRAADDEALQALADGLDLGQFRHGKPSRR